MKDFKHAESRASVIVTPSHLISILYNNSIHRKRLNIFNIIEYNTLNEIQPCVSRTSDSENATYISKSRTQSASEIADLLFHNFAAL